MHKGFKCLDIAKCHIYISQDVIFDENIFPFASLHSSANTRYHSDVLLHPPRNIEVSNMTNASTMTFLPAVDSMQVPAFAHKLALAPAPDEPRLSGAVIESAASEPLSNSVWVIHR
jgi:hypothetical protein